MAKAELFFQGVKDQRHVNAINEIYADGSCEKAIVSVAYALVDGVDCISARLKTLGPHASVYVGIRNKITSGQALLALLSCGVQLYAVDTGNPSVLFHPKIYFGKSARASKSLIGSANLTFSGLNNNIEASTRLSLSHDNIDDQQYVDDIETVFGELPARFPEHIIPVRRAREIVELMREGRVTDERIKIVSTQKADSRLRAKDLLGRIPIPFFRVEKRKKRKRARTIIYSPTRDISGDYQLVWTSNGMTERDLNIPSGTKTHATGSMLLKKGKTEDIDQRHYFFDRVFDKLTWVPDAIHPHLLRATAQFCIIIKGADYGVHGLKLTHNSSTTSAAYAQNNSMTQVHWGDAKELIATKDLLDSTLKLYINTKDATHFVMEFAD